MGDEVFCLEKNQGDRGVTIDKSIMVKEMYNANVYDSEEAVTMTELADKLVSANNMII